MNTSPKPPLGGYAKSGPKNRAVRGPFDFSEHHDVKPYVNLGGVLLPPSPGLTLRLQVEETTKKVVAVDLEMGESKLQVQAFAAPKSEGLWLDIMTQIEEQIAAKDGEVAEEEGDLGPEVLATVTTPDGGQLRVRYLGVDGPRWFLRGVVTGRAVDDREALGKVYDLFRSIVVRRGETPMPPRELIPMHVPGKAETDASSPYASGIGA